MPVLPPERIAELLQPYLDGSGNTPVLHLPPHAFEQLATYLDLLVKWNARVSLTSIREPEEMVTRHFGESLFTAAVLADRLPEGAELLDFGSGAGFPGLPIQIALPALKVTLAESQARKVAFLREVVRALGLRSDVWPRRVEEMPSSRRFWAVAMRAVDKMSEMQPVAQGRVLPGGLLVMLAGRVESTVSELALHKMPGSDNRYLAVRSVPRGTQPN